MLPIVFAVPFNPPYPNAPPIISAPVPASNVFYDFYPFASPAPDAFRYLSSSSFKAFKRF
jgi:hypothetical protein